jgi:hypothetical protein
VSVKTRTVFLFSVGLLASLSWIGQSGRPCRGDDAPAIKNILENGGLEGELDPATSLPAGWEVTQDPPNSYKVEVVDGGRSGKKCLRISGDGTNIQVRVKFLPMGPDHRSVCSGWMKYLSGTGMVSLQQRYQAADGHPLRWTRQSGYRLNRGQKASEWMQAAGYEFPELNPPGANFNFVINGVGKFEVLFDDLEVFTLAVTPGDLLWAKGHYEAHNFETPNRRGSPSTATGGTGEVSRVDNRPASGRYCLRVKANGDSATSSFEPKDYDPGKVYTLTGKVRVNSGRGTIRIDYYKDEKRSLWLGSATANAVESRDWQTLTINTRDNPPAGAAFITATCVALDNAEAFFDELTLLVK